VCFYSLYVEMNKILLVFLLVLGFCSYGLGDSCPWPNGTDKALHWWVDPSNLITIHDVQLYDANGKDIGSLLR
jgi:hypothetical protein